MTIGRPNLGFTGLRHDRARAEELACRATAWASGTSVSLVSGRRMIDLATQLLFERARELAAMEAEALAEPKLSRQGRKVNVHYAGEMLPLPEACRRAGLNAPSVHTLVHRWKITHQEVFDGMLERRAKRERRSA